MEELNTLMTPVPKIASTASRDMSNPLASGTQKESATLIPDRLTQKTPDLDPPTAMPSIGVKDKLATSKSEVQGPSPRLSPTRAHHTPEDIRGEAGEAVNKTSGPFPDRPTQETAKKELPLVLPSTGAKSEGVATNSESKLEGPQPTARSLPTSARLAPADIRCELVEAGDSGGREETVSGKEGPRSANLSKKMIHLSKPEGNMGTSGTENENGVPSRCETQYRLMMTSVMTAALQENLEFFTSTGMASPWDEHPSDLEDNDFSVC